MPVQYDGTARPVYEIASSLATSQASGNLGAVTILPGQAGSGDEGTAMLEIIHDLAPGAQLFFATAYATPAQFAQNIRGLRTAGCDIIVDDFLYFVETPFQDGQEKSILSNTNGGLIAQAVKDVTAAGALYFAAANNSGAVDQGTSGTWEGDFVDGGPATIEPGRLHSFGATPYVVVSGTTGPVTLHWSDPLGGSANDYDIFIFDSTGVTLWDFSTNDQSGTQDPYERMGSAFVGERIVIVKYAGAGRFLHLDTNRGRLTIRTAGSTRGHNATSSPGSFGVAATPAFAAYPNPFNSSNVVEYFSSDGPRHIFFTSTGVAITPGDVSATGGQLLQKPDFTAADGVSISGAGGFFNPFYGTSAAAPHAAAIAALLMSANRCATPTQIRAALIGSAIDIHAAGVDRDSGAGIIMADTSVGAVYAPPLSISTAPANVTIPANTGAALTVVAIGQSPTYQWFQGTHEAPTAIGGATSSTFLTPALHEQTSYWVRVSDCSGSVDSAVASVSVAYTDATSTFTDPVLTTGLTFIKAIHILELRTRINALRTANGLAAASWTDPTLVPATVWIRPIHILEMRTALDDVYDAKGLTRFSFTGFTAGSFVRAQHVAELRSAVTAVE